MVDLEKMCLKDFMKEYQRVINNEIKSEDLMKELGLCYDTYARYIKELKEYIDEDILIVKNDETNLKKAVEMYYSHEFSFDEIKKVTGITQAKLYNYIKLKGLKKEILE